MRNDTLTPGPSRGGTGRRRRVPPAALLGPSGLPREHRPAPPGAGGVGPGSGPRPLGVVGLAALLPPRAALGSRSSLNR